MVHISNNLLYGFLGWLAGIASLFIVEKNKEERRRIACKIAMASDLKNLAIRLAATSSNIQRHFGIYNRSSLVMLKKTYEKYGMDQDSKVLINIIALLKKLDETGIDEIRLPEDQFDALGLKRFYLPYIQSSQDSLLLFDQIYQRNILEILNRICILNEEVETAMGFYHKTFDSNCMDTNGQIVRSNMSNSYSSIQRICHRLMEMIDDIL